MQKMNKALILFSGGADSLLMLLMALDMWKANKDQFDFAMLSFNYGQKHVEEIHYADELAMEYTKRLVPRHMDLREIFDPVDSNLLLGKTADYAGVNPAHVPGRNTVFLAAALAMAESDGFHEIWHGADLSDTLGLFPDCTREYFNAMNKVFAIAGSCPIRITAPLLTLTKEEVVGELVRRGVDMKKVYSGYTPPK